jgi:cytochrome P450
MEFRPNRWPMPEGKNADTINTTSQTENLKNPSLTLQPPVKGAFSPWSGGPRICPGMKMAQVEFVAVIFTLFSKYRVEAVPKSGESLGDAQEKLRSVTMDSFPRLTLQMNHPENAVMRWTPRRGSN